MLKVLHTADWHVGRSFDQFDADDARKLARDRLSVIDRILGLADQYDVNAVLCAGDLFDSPDPDESWWRGLAQSFERRKSWNRPVVLLPGNHDPLTPNSVYSKGHPFRDNLPAWVRVVDEDNFQLEIAEDAVVCAAPCRSTAGDKDLALSLPVRCDGDSRIRIGLVHGSTFDIEGFATNFPVSRDAPQKCGLDYLAIGDTHSFREIPEDAVAPIVYPGAPEPTNFKEQDAGCVALVSFSRHGLRPRIQRERVARWTWRDVTVRSMPQLRAIAADDLVSTVLRLRLEMTISLVEMKEVDDIVSSIKGTEATHARAGAFVCDRMNLQVETNLDGGHFEDLLHAAPEVVRETAARLTEDARTDDEAKRALVILQRLLHGVR